MYIDVSLIYLKEVLNLRINFVIVTNIITHIWKLDNIAPIPQPNKDKATSYRSISLLSVIAHTGEEPSSFHNIKHTDATRVQTTTFYS